MVDDDPARSQLHLGTALVDDADLQIWIAGKPKNGELVLVRPAFGISPSPVLR
jgi:hypothetical protein